MIFDIEKVKSISKEEILPVFKIENKIKTPQDLLHDSFRDAAKSALEKGRNREEEEAIREKELEPYRQTHSSDEDDSPPNTLNEQTIAYQGQCVVKSKMSPTKTIYYLYTFYHIDASNQ